MDEDEYESFRANLGIFQVQSNKRVRRIRRGTQTDESNFDKNVENITEHGEKELPTDSKPAALKFGQKWHKKHGEK